MSTRDEKRDAAGREAYEQNLRNTGGFAAANAVRWDDLDPAARDRWIAQAETGEADGVDEPTVTSPSSADKTAAKSAPTKATKATGAKADSGKAAGE